MKRSTIVHTISTLAFVFSLSLSAQAQNFKSSDNPKVVKPTSSPKNSVAAKSVKKRKSFTIPFNPEDANGPTSNVRLNRELRYLRKFKILIESQMNLTTEDREKIFNFIDNHIETTIEKYKALGNKNTGKNPSQHQRNVQNDKGFNTMDEQLAAGQGGQMELIFTYMKDFVPNIMKVIPEKNVKEFEELHIRWGLTYHGPLPDDPLRKLNRVTKSPLVNVSKDTAQQVSLILRANMKKIGAKGRLDPVLSRKAYESAHEEIFKLLTKEQQVEVDKSVRLIDEYRKIMELDD